MTRQRRDKVYTALTVGIYIAATIMLFVVAAMKKGGLH